MQAFVAVAELSSFRAAGEALYLDPSTVSKLVQRVETAMGVQLLARSTRKVKLTPAGRSAMHSALALLAALDQFQGVASRVHDVA